MPAVKKICLVLALQLMVVVAYCQEHRFNPKLDKYCKTVIKGFSVIAPERQLVLDNMARQLAAKKYVLFTCKTNSRRTLLLQVWAQTSLYYYGVFGKYAFSIGDTVTGVYPGVIKVLKASGFYCKEQQGMPNRYVISVNEQFLLNMLSSKDALGTIDTSRGVIVNICSANEESGIAANNGHVNLPYQSPTAFEKKPQEKQKYRILNHQIALEMLYLARRTKELLNLSKPASEY
jgi:hypothetical protein